MEQWLADGDIQAHKPCPAKLACLQSCVFLSCAYSTIHVHSCLMLCYSCSSFGVMLCAKYLSVKQNQGKEISRMAYHRVPLYFVFPLLTVHTGVTVLGSNKHRLVIMKQCKLYFLKCATQCYHNRQDRAFSFSMLLSLCSATRRRILQASASLRTDHLCACQSWQ